VFAELAQVVARVAAEALDFSVDPMELDDAAAAFTSEVSAAIAEEVAEGEPQLEGASASRKRARVYALPDLFPVGFAVRYISEVDLSPRRVAAACCWFSAPGEAGCLRIRCSCAGASAWRVEHAVEAARSITGTASVAVGGEDCYEMRALRSAMSAAAALAVGFYMECIDGGGADSTQPGGTAATATRMVLNALANIAIGELEAEGGAVCGSVEMVEPVGRSSGYDPDLIVCLDRQELSPDGASRVVPVRYVLSTSAKVSCFSVPGRLHVCIARRRLVRLPFGGARSPAKPACQEAAMRGDGSVRRRWHSLSGRCRLSRAMPRYMRTRGFAPKSAPGKPSPSPRQHAALPAERRPRQNQHPGSALASFCALSARCRCRYDAGSV
jgi:hypothetical protein